MFDGCVDSVDHIHSLVEQQECQISSGKSAPEQLVPRKAARPETKKTILDGNLEKKSEMIQSGLGFLMHFVNFEEIFWDAHPNLFTAVMDVQFFGDDNPN